MHPDIQLNCNLRCGLPREKQFDGKQTNILLINFAIPLTHKGRPNTDRLFWTKSATNNSVSQAKMSQKILELLEKNKKYLKLLGIKVVGGKKVTLRGLIKAKW